ncbi:hypothetical protein HU200_067781 [Digitaria exilis]|uniref:Uncharacterized protein n=1 Tax=Digitaria exilis TaxID=1010633 RepID=A0A835DVM5_9POAL|nr:hypothetical protein HU200_067781 [Digitaria exilis]
MPFTPGPYSGVSTLALVARASAFGVGVVYGSIKLSILKVTLGYGFLQSGRWVDSHYCSSIKVCDKTNVLGCVACVSTPCFWMKLTSTLVDVFSGRVPSCVVSCHWIVRELEDIAMVVSLI